MSEILYPSEILKSDQRYFQPENIDINELLEITNRNQQYMADKCQMIPGYRRENETNNDYKGRQLLELIQNADDAGSTFVNIIVDTSTCTLSIVNGGEPFTVAGFRSLMIPNLSPKRKKKYIGNKGLGFRSVLNWSNRITVKSAGCILTFSKERARSKFFELYNEDERNDILKEFEYTEGTIPFPVLAVPVVEADNLGIETTIIEINYNDEVEEDILTQVKTLRKEVLLFLNHIENIHISINSEITEYISSKKNDKVSIGEQTWKVYTNKVNGKDPELPVKFKDPETRELESYSLRIAIQNDLSDNVNKLFTFFPTKIGLHFPMVIHGTFELDSSRNRIIESDKNKFLVEELVKLLYEVSGDFFGELATWSKFRLLNYKGNKDTVLEEFGFYTAIDNIIKTKEVLPCLDGKFRSYPNIKYHGDIFPELIKELEQQHHFPQLLDKLPEDVSEYFKKMFPGYLLERRFTSAELKKKAEVVSNEIYQNIPAYQYAKWIGNLGSQYSDSENYLSVLIGDKDELIKSDNTIFTPPSKNSLIEVPDHVNLGYLNTSLYESLIEYYNLSGDTSDKARKLKDRLESFVNIQSFEPAPVLTRVVTGTNQAIGNIGSLEVKKTYVQAMLRSLYKYYNLSNRAKDSQFKTSNIPVINKKGEIIYAKDSFLTTDYPSGLLREGLLGQIYEEKELIANSDVLGLPDQNDTIEEFLVDFLGVNKFLQLEKLTDRVSPSSSYLDFVFKYKKKPERFRSSRLAYTQIKNLDIIRNGLKDQLISREQVVCWLCVDNDIMELLRSHSDVDFRFDVIGSSSNVYPNRLSDVPSYIKFQLSSLEIFDGYLLNDLGSPILNDFQFNFKEEIFHERHIETTLIKDTLIQLGAKTDFNDLSIDRIEAILKFLPFKDAQGKHARRIYQLAIERFKDKGEHLKNISGLLLHSTKDKSKQYIPFEEVYYANNIGLPRKILNEKAVLNFPKRSGEQNIAEFFKVNTFDNIQYFSRDFKVNEISTSSLKAYLKIIRPYILVHRLQKLKSDTDIKEAVRIVKAINVVLCSDLTFDFNGLSNDAEEYDFVPSSTEKDTFLVKFKKAGSIELLKKDSDLCDVISEIYSIAFDVSNIRGEVRNIFRNDVEDTEHQVIEEFGEENLINSKSKLEITNSELMFWKAMFNYKQMPGNLPLVDDESDFRLKVSKDLNISRKLISQINYEALASFENLEYLKQLILALQIPLDEFNRIINKKLNFNDYHLTQFNISLEKFKEDFINCLWKELENFPDELRKEFIVKSRALSPGFIEELASDFKFVLEVDYSKELIKAISNRFGVKIEEEAKSSGYQQQFEKNKKLLSLTGDQLNSLANESLSLLYFNIGSEKLCEIRNQVCFSNESYEESPEDKPENGTEDHKEEDENTLQKPIGDLQPSGRTKRSTSPGRGSTSSPLAGGTHSTTDDVARKELGKKSEIEVLKSLRKEFGFDNVVWLSGYSSHPDKSDSWGYDIKYRINQDSQWEYVEVKSFYKNSFYFTNTELLTAKSSSDRYYIYLVDEQKISKILFSKLLSDNGELDLNNVFFDIQVKDYKFYQI